MPRFLLALVVLTVLAGAPATASAEPLELPDGFSTVTLADGLDSPTAIAYAPDGRLFIAEKAGRLRVVSAEGQLSSTPVLDVSGHVNNYGDRGLLGLALDSSFATNGLVYLLYTYDADPANPADPKTSRLTRIRVFPDNSVENATTDPEAVLLGSTWPGACPPPTDAVDCIPSDGWSHSIGTVRADADGTLWVGSGDASDYNNVDPGALRTYDEHSMSGKILHVDRQGRGLPGHAFCPAQTDLGLVCTKLHAKGFRNPFRFYLRPGGSPLAGDVGWGAREELDIVHKGGNYGWPCWEGTIHTSGYSELPACQTQYALADDAPAYDYDHFDGAAVQAGPRYTATLYPPQYRGSWFFGDYVQGFIRLLDVDDQDQIGNVRPFATGYHGVDLELDPHGDLVYVDISGGSVQRIVYGKRAPVAIATADPASGTAPLATTLSAEGSSDPDGDPMTYEWDFESDGTIDATGESVPHVYAAGAHTARLTVRDPDGLTGFATASVTVDESPPTATLTSPLDGSLFRHGTPVTLSGSGEDHQDGTLGDAALHWRIVLHHGSHVHVITADATGHELSFTPAGDHDADSYYEITLTARDSAGLTDTRTVNIRPETTTLTLDSSPPGVVLSYSGRDYTTPAPLTTAIGYHTTVSAPAEVQRDGVTYRFDSWSDGGARLHDIVVPDRDTTLRAIYRADAVPPPPALGGLGGVLGESAFSAPRVSLRKPTRAGTRSLGGRLERSAGRLRVEVALRTRGTRCRSWVASRGSLGGAHSDCGRPRWIRASVTSHGRGTWLWRVRLHGSLLRGSYVVSTRAVDAHGRVLAGVRSALVRIR